MAKNEVVETKKTELTFSEQLSEKLHSVSGALPKDFNQDRFVQNSLALLNDKPELAQFNKAQIMNGLLKGSYLGCDFFNGECWLIPYKGQLTFQLSYKGERKLAKKYATRPVLDIYAKVVRQGDEFIEKIVDGKPSIDFNPLPFNGGSVIGAFAVVLYEDGGLSYETMSIAEIETARKQGMGNSPAWSKFYSEMAKKTVLKRLCKQVDIDMENPTMEQVYHEDSLPEEQAEHEEVVDVFAEEEIIDATARELKEGE